MRREYDRAFRFMEFNSTMTDHQENPDPGIIPGKNRIRTVAVRMIMTAVFLLGMIFSLFSGFVQNVSADEDKTVRVGWYDSSYNSKDASGRRSGYAYEYQQKIASYTGWTYEYVTGSWPELLEMLEEGSIDLMSDVSYTAEREERMLFSSLPMGTEDYCIFITPDNTEISKTDYSTLNGKKIGVNRGSIQARFFREWSERHDINAELIEVTCPEEDSIRMIETGELDAYISVDSFVDPSRLNALCMIGSSDFYFAVNRNRPDLLSELNSAMSRIQEEDRYFNDRMFEKYIRQAGVSTQLSSQEKAWLAEHGPIRVGYQDNYLALCGTDEETNELTGALKDYLFAASRCFPDTTLEFDAIAYPSAAAAIEGMKNGEVDCVFPANLSSYDGEKNGLVLTPSLMKTDIFAIVRESEAGIFSKKEHVVVAVNEGNPNYDSFLLDHFPNWVKVYYPTTQDCLKAVSNGVADCVLISTYRYNNISRLCEKLDLTPYTTGEEMDYCIAVGKGNTALYSILARAIKVVPSSTVNTALSYYITEDARLTLSDFITDHLAAVLALLMTVLLVILVLMIRSMRAEQKARELISSTETDELTGLYNRNYFFQYAERMYREHPEIPMDAIVLNIDQFHSVNALNGREFGDEVLRVLGNEIKTISREGNGIAGRFEADRFDIYCRHMEEYQPLYDRLQTRLELLAPNASLRLRMGVMPWQPKTEPVQLFDMARTACSMARGHYKEHLIVFNEAVSQREMYEQRLLNDLRRALDSYEFEVYYQPKFDIQCEPAKLVSAEALVRWNHPELGMIPPDDFIPLFEKNGRIGAVDKYVWTEAARQIVRWREEYGVTIPVSVNLSRVDVFDPQLEATLDGILKYNGLDHDDLRLEVTESAYTENADQVIQVVEGLRKKGYVVEMDDFGTGYSSLNMLSAMPIDVLKMDRAFIRNIGHDEKDNQLVALILGIAKNLKIPVIAEGVETEDQIRLLKDLGCSLVQGYYFSRPLQASEFEALFIRKDEGHKGG